MRWSQVLFSQGFGTRRECAALIFAGRVSHAGRTVEDADDDVDTTNLEFEVEGRSWPFAERALVMLNKPAGYECSQRPGASPSVMTLLPTPLRQRNKGGVQAVGRLDVDTTGLLLLTDDGTLLHRLTSPKHHVPKVYEVTAKHAIDDAQIERLLAGVVLHDEERGEPRGGAQPVRAAAAERTGETTLRLTLTEGKYHQVKRMLAAVGNRCERLHRSEIGAFTLPPDLQAGQWRWLGAAEQAQLLTPPP